MTQHPNSPTFPSQSRVPGFDWEEGWVDATFMRSVFPPSFWDDRALAHIEEHLATEAKAVSSYEAFANAKDPAVRYLAGLIADDERRHHEVLDKIAEALRAQVGEKLVAHAHVELTEEERKELLDAARGLLDMEKADAAALKTLAHDVHAAPEESMWPVFIKMMEMDTEKHIHLLRAIERHLGAGFLTR